MRTIASVLAAALVSSAVSVALAQDTPSTICSVDLPGASFKLGGLTRPTTEPYVIQDEYNTGNNYTFNVCEDVAASTLPSGFHVNPSDMTNKDLPAYQIDTAGKLIYTLSQDKTQGWNFSFIGMWCAY